MVPCYLQSAFSVFFANMHAVLLNIPSKKRAILRKRGVPKLNKIYRKTFLHAVPVLPLPIHRSLTAGESWTPGPSILSLLRACEPVSHTPRDHMCVQSSTAGGVIGTVNNTQLQAAVVRGSTTGLQATRPRWAFSRARTAFPTRSLLLCTRQLPTRGNGMQMCEQLGGMRVQGRQPLYARHRGAWHSCCSGWLWLGQRTPSVGVIIHLRWLLSTHTPRSTRTREFRARSSITRPCARASILWSSGGHRDLPLLLQPRL